MMLTSPNGLAEVCNTRELSLTASGALIVFGFLVYCLNSL